MAATEQPKKTEPAGSAPPQDATAPDQRLVDMEARLRAAEDKAAAAEDKAAAAEAKATAAEAKAKEATAATAAQAAEMERVAREQAEAQESAEQAAQTVRAEREGFEQVRSDKKVKIRIATGEGEVGKQPVFASVNGYEIHIPRDKEVLVPRCVYENLLHATITDWTLVDGRPTEGREIPRYNVQVLD